MEPIEFATATQTLAGLRRGDFSSVELAQAYLERIQAHPWVNAIVTLDAERALDQARQADRIRRMGGPTGPLHGLPITVKHDQKVRGIPSTYGSESLRDYVPEDDAEAVARLRGAGAIVLGRSNLPEFASDGQAYNALHGTTRNPWDPERTTGGSSGGSAAAVAAGMTALDLGSDMGGSIRIPAAWCGVHGLKPTWGVVPMGGAVPHPADAEGADLTDPDVAVCGPLARGADDLDLALTVLTTPRDDRGGLRPHLPKARFRTHRELRVLAWFDDPVTGVDPATREVLDAALHALAGDGAHVTYGVLPPGGLDRLGELFELLFMADVGGAAGDAGFEELSRAMRQLRAESTMAELHHRALGLTHREWLALNRQRLILRWQWQELLEDYDVVVTPTVMTTALPHDHSEPVWARRFDVNGARHPWRPDLTRWCGAVGVLGLPAVTTPVGLDRGGLPVGMQVVAAPYHDRGAIAAARLISASTGGYTRPPLHEASA
ncbi:amidase family protein [Streptomyces griseorubiginosus]|uniref:amidase family protein n=1 Tax=Streptomyces griseorubiginosus TaxID=67304 RepID=UPI00368432E0